MYGRYNRRGRRKYNPRVHIVLVTKYRKPLLCGSLANDVKREIHNICKAKDYSIMAMEADKDHIHLLVSYDATDAVCNIVKAVKQATTHSLWQKYPDFLSKYYRKKKGFWSDGYFVCSVGEVSS